MTQTPPPPMNQPRYPMMAQHRGGVVLALGIIGLVLCGICGIVAWVMGNTDLKEMDAGRMDPTGRGMTQAGKILGIITVVLNAIGLVLTILWFVFLAALFAGAAASGGGPGTGP